MIIDSVITALSDVAKLPEPTMSQVCCQQLLQAVAKEVTMPENVNVEIALPDDFPNAFVDPLQIPIVFRNLLRNARDAMPDGGTIHLNGERLEDGRLMVHVQDTGDGMDSELLSRIFEPLFTTKARGMGLGLAICKAILDKNEGALHIQSEPGKGSCFSVELSTPPTS